MPANSHPATRLLARSLLAFGLAVPLAGCGLDRPSPRPAVQQATLSPAALKASGKALVVMQSRVDAGRGILGRDMIVPATLSVSNVSDPARAYVFGSDGRYRLNRRQLKPVKPYALLLEPGNYSLRTLRFDLDNTRFSDRSEQNALPPGLTAPTDFTVAAGEVVNLGTVEVVLGEGAASWQGSHSPDYEAGARLLARDYPQVAPLAVQRVFACHTCSGSR